MEIPQLTVAEAYLWVQLNLNKLANNNNQNIPKYQFVIFFNTALIRWFESRIKYRETHSTVIDELQQFHIETSIPVSASGSKYVGSLPDNYAHYSRIYSSQKGCTSVIDSIIVKESDINKYLHDNHYKPSVAWLENLATVTDNKINVYSDVPLTSVNLVYYRFPKGINMADGHTDINGEPTVDIDPEITGSNLYEVLNLTVRDLAAAINDGNRSQYASAINQIHT